jgi:hypothetical protein
MECQNDLYRSWTVFCVRCGYGNAMHPQALFLPFNLQTCFHLQTCFLILHLFTVLLFMSFPEQSRIALEELTLGSNDVRQVTWTVYWLIKVDSVELAKVFQWNGYNQISPLGFNYLSVIFCIMVPVTPLNIYVYMCGCLGKPFGSRWASFWVEQKKKNSKENI